MPIYQHNKLRGMKMNPREICITLLILGTLLIPFATVSGGTFTVTNTNDSGAGSFRWAIGKSNYYAGGDLIDFAIPLADPNYNTVTGVWTISPISPLDTLTDGGTVIDAGTQVDFIGYDTNPNGREIEIEGSSAGATSGICIMSSWNTITGLTINRFEQFGIVIKGYGTRYNAVNGNLIGTDPNGVTDLGNGFSGILIYTAAAGNMIGGPDAGDGNLVSGNGWSGIEIQGNGADSNYVYGNFVGTDFSGTTAIGNDQCGIRVWSHPEGNTIGGSSGLMRNVVSGNSWEGINVVSNSPRTVIKGNYVGVTSLAAFTVPNGIIGISCGGDHTIIGGTGAGEANIVGGSVSHGIYIFSGDSITVAGNSIGTNAAGTLDLGNGLCGIYAAFGATDCTIGPSNTIWNNAGDGVRVDHDSTIGIRISQNSISNNDGLGINNLDGGNTELSPPVILFSDGAGTNGTAPPFSTVEIYSDDMEEGRIYEGAASASGTGDWYWSGTATGPNVTAIAIDLSGNTSEFSTPWIPTAIVGADADLPPATCFLGRNMPNPFNPLTTISYRLSHPGRVNLSIYNTAGELVETMVDEWQVAGVHSVVWAPQGGTVVSGVYFCRLTAGEFSSVRKMTLVR